MAAFDIEAFKARFQARAKAVKERGVPPIEGDARRMFIEAAQQDFVDYSLIADAEWSVEDGALVMRMPLAESDEG